MEKIKNFELHKYDELKKIESEISRYKTYILEIKDKINNLKADQVLSKRNNSLEIEKLEKEIQGINDKLKF